MDRRAAPTELRILQLEDEPTDAELVENALREAGLSFTFKRVDTHDAFVRALEEFQPDIVLADYKLPGFDGGSAVKIVRKEHPEIPVVMVTGAVGDEKAVELLALGAKDYILKDRLARLAPAVQRALSAEQGVRARKAAEKALRQSEERFRGVFENAKDVILTLSRVGNLMMLNPAFERITGWACAEWLGKSISPLVHPDDLANVKHLVQHLAHDETIPAFELRVRKKAGGYVVGEVTIARLAPDGAYVLAIARDITERKEMEERIRESELKFRTVVETTSDWIWEVDEQGVYTYASPRVSDLLGHAAEEVIGKTPFDLMPPEEAARVGAIFRAIMAEKRPFQLLENTCVHKDGRAVVLESSGVPVFNGNGAFRGYRGIDRDITERKRAEEKLRESEARYRRITEGITDYQYTVRIENGHAVETTQSPACVTVTGYKAEEFAANPYLWIQMVAPEDRELVTQHFRQIHAGKDVPPLEHRIIRKDGDMRWVSDTTILFRDTTGKLVSYDGVIKDITEHRQMEEAIREVSDRNRAITETANDAIVCVKPDGAIYLWNHKAEEMFGFTAAEAIGENIHELITPAQYRGKEVEGLRQFARTGAGAIVGKTTEITALRRGGAEFPIELSVSSMNVRGEWHATGIIRDITGRKQTEARIQKLTRLYATLSQTNMTIVRATNREELFARVCENAVEHGKFKMAWVGLVDEAARVVRPICHYGAEQGYLENISISIDDVPEGRGPTGTAIRENRVSCVNDYAADERTWTWREGALKRGFRGAAGVPLRLRGKAIGALTMYADETNFFDADQLQLLEEMATDISFALDGFEREALRRQAEEGRETALLKLRKALEGSIGVAASISEVRDPYTAGHQLRVSQLATAIAFEMGLPQSQVEGIRFGSLIHDIGKIGVPAEILSKPSRLTVLEMELIQVHPKVGYEIVKDIEFPWPVAKMILQHHERLDGKGYPAGLKGDDIIPEARIIAVADTVEAMSSHRPYRAGLGVEAALAEISGASGVRYDAQVVEACIRLFRDKGFTFG